MLRESWDYLLRVSTNELGLIPADSLADRIGGQLITSGPWMAWLGNLPPLADRPRLEEIDLAQALKRGTAVTAEIHRLGPKVGKTLHKIRAEFGRFLQWAEKNTLQIVFSKLAKSLSDYPEARFWLSTRRFSDLERQVVYWLKPTLDPRIQSIMEFDPKLELTLINVSRQRTLDTTALLTNLNLSSTTALRAAFEIFRKLFIQPAQCLPGLGQDRP
jgi:hypothetical protein